MDEQPANSQDVCCLKHPERGIPEHCTPIAFPLQTMIKRKAPEDRHGNRIGHVPPKAAERFADHDAA